MEDIIEVSAPKSTPDQTYLLPSRISYFVQRPNYPRADESWQKSMLTAARLMQVQCPKCGAPRERWCRLPDGSLYDSLHVDRWRKAYSEGWWEAVTLTLPVLPDEDRRVPR